MAWYVRLHFELMQRHNCRHYFRHCWGIEAYKKIRCSFVKPRNAHRPYLEIGTEVKQYFKQNCKIIWSTSTHHELKTLLVFHNSLLIKRICSKRRLLRNDIHNLKFTAKKYPISTRSYLWFSGKIFVYFGFSCHYFKLLG